MKPLLEQVQTPVVVHFDINETILLGDIAGGDTAEECLHKIIAKSALVQIPASYDLNRVDEWTPTHWYNGNPLDTDGTSIDAPQLWNHPEWPSQAVPYYRTAFKSRSKNFLDHHGAPYRQILEKVELPPSEGPFAHLLPALFATLYSLAAYPQVRVVFRTMGTDLPFVAEAVTAFAKGQHPNYPHFYHEPYIWDSPKQFFRATWNDGGVFGLHQGSALVAETDAGVQQHIRQLSICGIQDDYLYWKRNGFRPEAGKPVWKQDSEYHVLFDDNIYPMLPNFSIAGIRNEEQFWSGSQHGVHLVPVRTLSPLTNPNWFLETLEQSLSDYIRARG